MGGRRSGRSDTLASSTALLDQVAPAYHAITRAESVLTVSGAQYQALNRAREALARLAADLGHDGRFSAPAKRQ